VEILISLAIIALVVIYYINYISSSRPASGPTSTFRGYPEIETPKWFAVKEPPKPLKWYEIESLKVAVRSYRDTVEASLEANAAASYGWTVQSVATSDGHVNVGRTVTGAVLTGGLSLLVGGSRTKGSVTITFVR
jgi:hypothetical protein